MIDRSPSETAQSHDSGRCIRRWNAPLQLKPIQEEILRVSGWLDYVLENIDVLRYRDRPCVTINGERAVAYAAIIKGKRWVEVAVARYDDWEIAQSLVHEAAHLEIWTKCGELGTQEYAISEEKEFLEDYCSYLVKNGDLEDLIWVTWVDAELITLYQPEVAKLASEDDQ
jgi:hypothetical protein